VLAVLLLVAGPRLRGQQLSNALLFRNLTSLDTNRALSAARKLQLLYEWKKESETLGLPRDSVYARLLHKIGVYEFYAGKNYYTALVLTLEAMRINTSGRPGACARQAATDLYNIALYYDNLQLFRKALIYYDSAILLAARNGPDVDGVIGDSRADKAYLYFRNGDYDRAVEEGDRARIGALEAGDSLRYLYALNQLAQALFFQGKLKTALEDARIAIALGGRLHEDFEVASALKSQGLILAGERDFPGAEASFIQCITERIRSKKLWQVASDYNDFGNFYSDTLKAFYKADACYTLGLDYARREGDSNRMARVLVNWGRNCFYSRAYENALACFQRALRCLKIAVGADPVANPTALELEPTAGKEMIQTLFDSKTQVLLALYRRTGERKWLRACVQTALLSDSLIGTMRHEMLGEQSKLFWRNRTRSFFACALEACYLAGDSQLAFYFMEKSRSVLLQDKLDELGARAYLPAEEAAKQEKLQIERVEAQQRLASLADTSAAHPAAQKDLLASNERLEQYIKTLETSYPAYYQYKYANRVQSVASLQAFLAKNRQCFLEYFIEDTVCYALCITRDSCRFIRETATGHSWEERLAGFVRFCSDENALNRDFPGFVRSAHELYELLFRPFAPEKGRVIVCQDSYLVPFEALSASPLSADFLIRDYSFSYVYSARYLLNPYASIAGKGDFLGVAPIHFMAYGGVPDLDGSEEALKNCAAPYGRRKLLLDGDASRKHFIDEVVHYNTSTILTHARADSSDDEPLLFMNDSVIHLSELQLLDKPAAKLIVLSACETNVGRNRNGEGVFSLARGFSAAGIPAVAATQWAADEAAIYAITQRFNEYLAAGLNKDEALQQAKLFYMQQDKKNVLPYYWADMILIGNTEPIKLSGGSRWGWYLLVLALIAGGAAVRRYWTK
jgi:CHAT domain-containing protein